MPKIPDFSKFDLQSIVNSVKSIINPEPTTPKVAEGDPIGTKVVQISTLLQNLTHTHAQAAKDLTEVNNLLNELYKDLEVFRKLEAEMRLKQQAEARAAASTQDPQSKAETTPHPTSTSTSYKNNTGVGEPTHEKIEPTTTDTSVHTSEDEELKK